MSSLPPLGQSVPIDQAFLNAMTQGLQSAQQSAATSAAIPSPAPAPVRPAYSPGSGLTTGTMGLFNTDPFADVGLPDKISMEQQLSEAGISNEGAPFQLRAEVSRAGLTDPANQKSVVEFNLRRFFKDKGLIGDDYDFGVRLGGISNRLEFKDPRNNGQYTVFDPYGAGDIVADLFADLQGDAMVLGPEIATSLAAGAVGTMGGGPAVGGTAAIITGATTAWAAEVLRLLSARRQGLLPDTITDDVIYDQALNTAKWSALGGAGGALAFKILRPLAVKLGLATSRLRMDIDEETFIRAYEDYQASAAGQAAANIGITPSSAQVVASSIDQATQPGEAAARQFLAGDLQEIAGRVARSEDPSRASSVIIPERQAAIEGEAALTAAAEKGSPPGVTISSAGRNSGEREFQRLGEGVVANLDQQAVQLRQQAEATLQNAANDIDAAIQAAANVPVGTATRGDIGEVAQEVIRNAEKAAAAGFNDLYSNIFQRWSQATGVGVDEVVLTGKNRITLNKLVNVAKEELRTIKSGAIHNAEDRGLLETIINRYVDPADARKRVPVSLETLNNDLRELRALERRAFKKSQSGEEAPYPRTIKALTDAIEETRDALFRRKGVPDGLADELRAADDLFTESATMFKGRQVSAIAALSKAQKPEAMFKAIIGPDRKFTAELAAILKRNPENADLVDDIGAAIRREWLETVYKPAGRTGTREVNNAAHQRFMQQYGDVMRHYLTDAEIATMDDAAGLASRMLAAQNSYKTALSEVNKSLRLAGGDAIDNPDKLFKYVWQGDTITPLDKIMPILNREPRLKASFQALVLRDMAGTRTKKLNGWDIPDVDAWQTYLNENRDKLNKVFGNDYSENLQTVLDGIRPAFTDVSARAKETGMNPFLAALRGIVGTLTRAGRALTFAQKVRINLQRDAITQALTDPRAMYEMAKVTRKASGRAITQREVERSIGRIFQFDLDGIGFENRGEPSDSSLPIKRSSAAEILNDMMTR